MNNVAIFRFSLADPHSNNFAFSRLRNCDVNETFHQELSALWLADVKDH